MEMKSFSTHTKQHIEEDEETFEAAVNFPHRHFLVDFLSGAEEVCV